MQTARVKEKKIQMHAVHFALARARARWKLAEALVPLIGTPGTRWERVKIAQHSHTYAEGCVFRN